LPRCLDVLSDIDALLWFRHPPGQQGTCPLA